MKTQPHFYYSSRRKINNHLDIMEYNLKEGSILLSNRDSDRASNIYPAGYIYTFKINAMPKTARLIKDTSDFDHLKVMTLIRSAASYQTVVGHHGNEKNLFKVIFSKERQAAVYKAVFDLLYVDDDYSYAKNMVSLGWAGYLFNVKEPDLLHGGPANYIKTVARIWDPKYLELLTEEEWDVYLSQKIRDQNED